MTPDMILVEWDAHRFVIENIRSSDRLRVVYGVLNCFQVLNMSGVSRCGVPLPLAENCFNLRPVQKLPNSKAPPILYALYYGITIKARFASSLATFPVGCLSKIMRVAVSGKTRESSAEPSLNGR